MPISVSTATPRKNNRTSHHPGLVKEEQDFLNFCERAGSASDHFNFIEEQRSHGWSDHFATSWRNALGQMTERALRVFLFSWKSWETHTTNCKTYWEGRSLLDALFCPSVGQLAHYLAGRSTSGPTAAAGAHTSLAGCAIALKLSFAMSDVFFVGLVQDQQNTPTHSANPD